MATADLALRATQISKRYNIHGPTPHALRDSLLMAARRAKRGLLRQPPPVKASEPGEFWALKDVSFEVEHGERVGIIGRNGAGKSTLLKILSRVTKPTSGHADIYGRLGALLEVGTGFHPELSGRENIYLNATILGLSKADIARRLDEIVAFAEIDQFIDTPIKHYSSGMFMRLAFSVSAHLDPDILVLDEVLAVGDASFQKKCLGKMDGVAKSGRTVLLVSHSVPSIVSFCDRCLLLDRGQLVKDGDAAEVTGFYQESVVTRSPHGPDVLRAQLSKTNRARLASVLLTPRDAAGREQPVLRVGQNLDVEVTVIAEQRIIDANVAMVIFELDGHRLIDANLALKNDYLSLAPGEEATVCFSLRNLLLRPDTYRIGLWIGRRPIEDIDIISDAATFDVEVDPKTTKHFQVFPGPYQCEFTHSKTVRSVLADRSLTPFNDAAR